MATRNQVLETTEKFVSGLIKRLTPDPETACVQAFEELGPLVRKSRSLTAGDAESDVEFGAGIQSVINRLDALRTGFARTYEQENGIAKADGFKPITKDMTPSEFVAFAASMIRKAIKCSELGYVGKALEALRTLAEDIRKAASFEDTTTITVTVENDPMRMPETEAAGTTAPAGTSMPSTAASNYVTNPAGVSSPLPSTAPNPSTGSAETQTSPVPAGTSNFIAKTDEAAPVVPAASVASEVDVAKAADEAIAKGLDEIGDAVSKADPEARFASVGWANDLNSPAFLHGARGETF